MDLLEDMEEDESEWPLLPPPAMGEVLATPLEPLPMLSPLFPPHWGELMEQIRVREEEMKRVMLSRRSADADSSSAPPRRRPSPPFSSSSSSSSSTSSSSSASPYPPSVPFPHMPFWTAAPLPFSPHLYPVHVLPPLARESSTAPRAPPRPQPGKLRKKPARKARAGRARDARGLFLKSEPGGAAAEGEGEEMEMARREEEEEEADKDELRGRIQELQKQLQESRFESVVLREQLVHSQHELSQLKDRGLVRASLAHHQLSGPSSSSSASSLPVASSVSSVSDVSGSSSFAPSLFAQPSHSQRTAASSPPLPGGMDAFRVSLDYAQIKSKLRPTGYGHYYEPDIQTPHPEPAMAAPAAVAPQFHWDLSE